MCDPTSAGPQLRAGDWPPQGPSPAPLWRVFIIEGEIGAGKSELIRGLAGALAALGHRVVTVPEPVDEWRAVGISQRFYEDPAAYGYRFQTFVFATRVLAIRRAVAASPGPGVLLLERSPATDLIFMELARDLIDPMEMEMYAAWCDAFRLMLPIDLAEATVLYLKTSLGGCMARLEARNRGEEQAGQKDAADEASAKGGVSLGYQARLRRAHEAFFWGAHAGEFPALLGRSPFPRGAVLEIEPALADGNFRDPGPDRDAILAAIVRKMALP